MGVPLFRETTIELLLARVFLDNPNDVPHDRYRVLVDFLGFIGFLGFRFRAWT